MAFRFETLEIWQMARAYAADVYRLTAAFPRHEDYGLRSRMNLAVNSIGLNIAEGTAKGSNRAFDYHLIIAIGSVCEVVAAFYLAFDRAYVTQAECADLYAAGDRFPRG